MPGPLMAQDRLVRYISCILFRINMMFCDGLNIFFLTDLTGLHKKAKLYVELTICCIVKIMYKKKYDIIETQTEFLIFRIENYNMLLSKLILR